MNTENAYIIFTDLKGFSKLSEPEYKIFYNSILNDLSDKIIKYKAKSIVWNTWGDALVAILKDKKDVINLLFDYRNFFRNYNFESKQISKLYPRVAAHFGQFDIYDDPLISMKNAIGENINTTARIEPITRVNEIYVTQEFKNNIEANPQTINNIKFIEIGEIPLAKNFGERNIYRLIKDSEEEKIIDRIIKQDLSSMLPEAEVISEIKLKELNYFKNSPTQEQLLKSIKLGKIISDDNINENYLLEVAKICKNFGLYTQSLQIIDKIENQYQNVDGVNLVLYKYNIQLMKLKTNCLTRLGQYEDASNIIYGVWQLNNKDSDTLSMLAAQYKRRALTDENGNFVNKENINLELLERALNLYIEAFRLDIEDYYPAINIAYLYKIMGGVQAGRGNKLANFIQKTWQNYDEKDWWLDITLLECDIIQDDLENIDIKLDKLLNQYKPNYFEKRAVLEQIDLYKHFVDIDDSIEKILKKLKDN
jgi:tetratricopeptide (TPR) repeat protein